MKLQHKPKDIQRTRVTATWVKCIRRYACRMYRWSFWSWFDENWSIL